MSRVIVVGAGLSGLACAHDLVRRDREVLVLEARDTAGGVVGTLDVEGFRFETGPNTIAGSARTFRRLCVELGLADLWVPSSAEASARYLWHDGRLQAVPMGPLDLIRTRLLSRRAKLRLLGEPFRRRAPHPAGQPEPTLAEFLEERLGPELVQRFAAPFVRGIYAGEIGRLGARSAFPRLWRMADEHGGLLRGALRREKPGPPPGPEVPRGRLLSFQRGLRVLVEGLAGSIGERLRTSAPVQALHRRGGHGEGWRVELADGEELEADELVLAAQAPQAARLLATAGGPPELGEAARHLAAIPHADVTLVHLGLDESELPDRPRGFGYLVPPDAGPDAPRVLGTVFGSDLFPNRAPEGAVAVSAFYRSSELGTTDTEEAGRVACEDLARAFHLARTPRARVVRSLHWKGVIPQYGIGHAEAIERIEADLAREWGDVYLAGSYVGGVSVDDVLARGLEVARRASSGRTHQVSV